MKPPTVAERAAELGMDQHELVHALRILSSRKLKRGKRRHRSDYWWPKYYWHPVMSTEQAALCFGIDPADAHAEITRRDWRQWTFSEMKDAMFAFYKREGRWPLAREYTLKNGLPPYLQWASLGRRRLRDLADIDTWMLSAPDVWQRLIARDRRCTPEMAFQLRNVLARKEAIERIGFAKLLKSGVAEVVDEHPEYGVLYRVPGETPKEPMLLLKVVNSTPEPDGSFADYYLRVPPDQTNVREALTWTFNGNEALGSQPYEPLVQT